MTYASKRKPRAKQEEALRALEGRDAFALLMAMRTGKTKVVVDDWGRQVSSGDQRDLLVLAPGGAYRPWQKALADDLPDDILGKTRVHVWVSSKAKTKAARKEVEDLDGHDGPRVLIVNAEAVSAVEAARDLCLRFLGRSPGKNCLAIDESVIIKNPEAKLTGFVVNRLAPLARQRRILTGLVSPQSPLDVYCQFKFLDPKILGHDKFSTFRARHAKIRRICTLPNAVVDKKFRDSLGLHCLHALSAEEARRRLSVIDPGLNVAAMDRLEAVRQLATAPDRFPRDRAIEATLALGGWIQTIPTIEGYLHVEEIHDKIRPHSFRCRLEDCYDMPESDYSFRDVEFTSQQRRCYDEMKRHATIWLEDGRAASASNVITQMLRLHQVCCGHVVEEGGEVVDLPERRTAALLDLLLDYDGKAVIWCSYDRNVRSVAAGLEREFGRGSVARFWGGNVSTREREEESFRTDPACRFMVGTPDAGGRGRTWDVADLVVYYSCRNNLDHRSQSEERAKADGKTRPVAYVDLRIPGTVEDKIVGALRDKIDMAAAINGDNWREWLV